MNKPKIIFLSLILLFTKFSSSQHTESPFYRLISIFSSSDELVDEVCKEIDKAKVFSNQIKIIKETFDDLTNIQKKELLLSIDEEILHSLRLAAPKKVIDKKYMNDLNQSIKNLEYYEEKLPKRLRKLKKIKNEEKFKTTITDISELIDQINIILPNLKLLLQYVNQNSEYFELVNFMKTISSFYSTELDMFEAKKIITGRLKRAARSKHQYSTYPLLDYVDLLSKDISRLEKYKNLACRYKELYQEAKVLKKRMIKINQLILSDKDYFSEKRDLEIEIAQKEALSKMKKKIIIIEKEKQKTDSSVKDKVVNFIKEGIFPESKKERKILVVEKVKPETNISVGHDYIIYE